MTRPGYKTTEFWHALATQVITLLVLFGVIDRPELSDALSRSVTATATLIANAIVVGGYIRSRMELKRGGQ